MKIYLQVCVEISHIFLLCNLNVTPFFSLLFFSQTDSVKLFKLEKHRNFLFHILEELTH
jgi:hypothetical protein